MKEALKQLFGNDIDFTQPLDIAELERKLNRKYPSSSKELKTLAMFVFRFLFFNNKNKADRAISDVVGAAFQEIGSIISLMALHNKTAPNDLEREILKINPYIYFNFLVNHLQSNISSNSDDSLSDNFIHSIFRAIDQIGSISFDSNDNFLLDKIYIITSQIATLIDDEEQFTKYQNLICFICNFHPQGDEVLISLIDQISRKNPSNPTLLKNIITKIQKDQIQIKHLAGVKTKPFNEKIRKVLEDRKKEFEFAKIAPERMKLIQIIKIFSLYDNQTNYLLIETSTRNIKKALDYIENKVSNNSFSETELYLLTGELKNKENFLSIFVEFSSKTFLNKFCDFIQEKDDLDDKEKIIELIKSHRHYKSKTQNGRLKMLLEVDEEDLSKTGEDFDKILEGISKKQRPESDEPFYLNLCALSNPTYFHNLNLKFKISTIQDFVIAFVFKLNQNANQSDDVILSSIYCFTQCQLFLINTLIANELRPKEREQIEVLFATWPKFSIQQQALKIIIGNQELLNLSDDVAKIYQKLGLLLRNSTGKNSLDNLNFALEQIFFINRFGLDNNNEFRFFVKEIFKITPAQLLKSTIEHLNGSVQIQVNQQAPFKAGLTQDQKKILSAALQNYNLCTQETLEALTAIINFRFLFGDSEKGFMPEELEMAAKRRVSEFFSKINFDDPKFPIAINEMVNNNQFLAFFLQQQIRERIIGLVQFLNNNVGQKNIPLLAAKIVNYYNDGNNPELAEFVHGKVSLELKRKMEQALTELLSTNTNQTGILDKGTQTENSIQSTSLLELAMSEQRANFDKEISRMEDQRQLATRQLKAQLAEKDAELQRTRAELAKTTNAYNEQQKQLTKTTKELSDLKIQQDKAHQQAQQELAKARKENDDLKAKLKQSEQEKQKLESQKATLLKQKDGEITKVRQQLDKSRLELKAKSKQNDELKLASQTLENESQELKLQLESRDNELQKTQQELTHTSQILAAEIKKHQKPAALSINDIDARLTEESQKTFVKVEREFGNVIQTLQRNLSGKGIAAKSLEITGSQVYVPLLRMLDNVQFKDDGEPQDLDLCLVIGDNNFSQNLSDKNKIKQLIGELLPNFQIAGEPHLAQHPKQSASIKLKYGDREIDLNIYGESCHEKLSQCQFNADRIKLSCDDGKFKINNNGAIKDDSLNSCQKFLLALQKKEINLWQHNPEAKGFLNRILKDCGRLKLPPAALEPIEKQLIDEMEQICQGSGIDFRDWEAFKQHQCSKLVECCRDDELAMVKNTHKIMAARSIIHQQATIISQQTTILHQQRAMLHQQTSAIQTPHYSSGLPNPHPHSASGMILPSNLNFYSK
jgi:hypothetical protein